MNLEGIISRVEKQMVDATALVVASQPVYAFFELYVGHVPPDTSFGSRLWAIGTTYAGVGLLVSMCREWWKSRARIAPGSSEKRKLIHDMGYKAVFNVLTQPITYVGVGLFTEGMSVEKIVSGTVATTVVAFLSGGYECYVLDAFRELWGVNAPERLPMCVQNMTSAQKKGIALVFSAVSYVSLGFLYMGKV